MAGESKPRTKNEPLRALITNIQGFSTEDGPGIRTTVFFKGCPLKCPWCHNPEGLVPREELIFYENKCIACGECGKACEHGAPIPGGPGFEECESCFKCVDVCPAAARQKMGEWFGVEELVEAVLRDRVFYETSEGGVTASGGEAMVWADFLASFFRRLKQEGIHTALDTSGVVGGLKLQAVLEHTDLALVDLKIMDPEKHLELIGVELAPILEHIREIDGAGVEIHIRIPLVPGYTDSYENLSLAADFIKTLKMASQVDLLPYHRMAEPKYRQLGKSYPLLGLTPPTAEEVERARNIIAEKGLKALVAGKE